MSAAEQYFVYWSTLGIEKPFSKDFATPELFEAALAKFMTDAAAAKLTAKVYKSPLGNFSIQEETAITWETLETNISVLANEDLCRGNVAVGYLLTEGINTNTVLMLVSDTTAAAGAPLKRALLSQNPTEYTKFNGRPPTKRIRDADAAIVAAQAPQQNLKGVGFVLARERPMDGKKGLYLDVICTAATAAGVGGRLLTFFESYGVSRAMTYLELSALPSVIGLYIKPAFGYKYAKKCTDEGIPLSAELSTYLSNAANPKPKNNEESYAIPAFMNYMITLHRAGLNKKAAYDEVCANPRITAAKFKDNNCGSDGFKMIKCFGAAGGSRRHKRKARRTRRHHRN